MRQITKLVLHHTAGPSGSLASITAEHIKRGFGGCGYHSLVTNGHGGPDGQVFQGRPDSVKGCGVWGANTGALHIALVGDFTKTAPTHAQLVTLGEWLLHRAVRYGVTRILGHKEAALPSHPTACPGALPLDRVRQWFAVQVPLYRAMGAPTESLAAFLEAL
jgi:N-acetylmuramoyl-L-alanine amidase